MKDYDQYIYYMECMNQTYNMNNEGIEIEMEKTTHLVGGLSHALPSSRVQSPIHTVPPSPSFSVQVACHTSLRWKFRSYLFSISKWPTSNCNLSCFQLRLCSDYYSIQINHFLTSFLEEAVENDEGGLCRDAPKLSIKNLVNTQPVAEREVNTN